MQTHLNADSPSPVIRVTLFFLVQKVGPPSQREIFVTFLKGNVFPAFREKMKGQRTLHVSVDSQSPSAQNNPDARVTYQGEVGYILIPVSCHQIIWGSWMADRAQLEEETGLCAGTNRSPPTMLSAGCSGTQGSPGVKI